MFDLYFENFNTDYFDLRHKNYAFYALFEGVG